MSDLRTASEAALSEIEKHFHTGSHPTAGADVDDHVSRACNLLTKALAGVE